MKTLILTLLLISLSISHAQDKLVVLNKKVGNEIDSKERAEYSLFPNYNDFTVVKFYQKNNNEYHGRFKFIVNDNNLESIIVFSAKNIIRIAEQIEFLDLILKNEYYAGKDSAYFYEKDGRVFIDFLKSHDNDLLPFAKNIKKTDDEFTTLAIGFSYVYFKADFSGIQDYFNGIENKYSSQGFPIIHHHLNLKPNAYYSFTGFIKLYKGFGLSMDYTKNIGSDLTINSASIALTYNFTFKKFKYLSPYVGAGISGINYKTEDINYGDLITITDPNGSYSYIESISSSGGSTGLKLLAGCDIKPFGLGLGLNLFVSYLYFPKSVSKDNGIISEIKFGGLMTGVGIKIHL